MTTPDLATQLLRYARHLRGCEVNPGGPIMAALGMPEKKPCTCGLDQLVAATNRVAAERAAVTRLCDQYDEFGEVYDPECNLPLLAERVYTILAELTLVAKAAYKWHHRFCNAAPGERVDEGTLWRELDQALDNWRNEL